MEPLSSRGKAVRVLVTALGLALVWLGSTVGQDDHFPFGPFRMFATTNPPDAPAPDTRIEVVDATGAIVVLTESNSGIRRAEVEGQLSRYHADPPRLVEIRDAYAARHPDAPRVVEVRVVIRWHGIRDGRPTGEQVDETVVYWRVP